MTDSHWFDARRERVAFAVASVLLLLPLLVFFLLPTQDGPVHTYNAELLRQVLAGEDGWFSRWLVPSDRFDPTWPPHLVLMAMVTVLPQDLAEGLYQAGAIFALPWAMRYAITGFRAEAAYWAWLALPFAYGFTFHLGFYSFCYGVSTALLMLGFWWRCLDAWNPRRVLAMGAIAVLAFYTHVFPMLVIGVFMVPLAVLRFWESLRADGAAGALRDTLLPQVLAFLPALTLVAEFMLSRETLIINDRPLAIRIAHLGSLSYLLSYNRIELIGSVLVALLFGLLALWSLRYPNSVRDRNYWALLAGALAVVLLFLTMNETELVSPNGMRGGGFMIRRTQPVLFLALLLWLAWALHDVRWRPRVVLAGAFLCVLGIGLRWPAYSSAREQLREYGYAAQFIGKHETVLALNAYRGGYAPDGSGPLLEFADPYRHYVTRLAAQRDAFSINNYEAVVGYFPLIYRDAVNPWYVLGRVEDEPPLVDLRRFEAALQEPLDVILVWGGERRGISLADIHRQLDALGFRRVGVSPGIGLMVVYRRPEAGAAGSESRQ